MDKVLLDSVGVDLNNILLPPPPNETSNMGVGVFVHECAVYRFKEPNKKREDEDRESGIGEAQWKDRDN